MKWSPTRRKFLGVAGASVPALAAGTPLWGNVTDVVPDHPLAPSGDVRWSVETGETEAVVRYPVSDGRLYVQTPNGVRALGTDGNERWRFDAESRDSEYSVEAYGESGSLYVETERGLHALDATDGSVRWRYAGENGGHEHVDVSLVTPETVLLHENGVTALDADDGTERWRFEPDDPVWFGAHFDGESLYVGTIQGQLYALDANDGSVRWRAAVGAADDAPHVFPVGTADATVFAWNSSEGGLTGFGAADGNRRWTVETNTDSAGFPGTIDGSTVYLGDESALRAVSATDGVERWRYDAGAASVRSPRIADGTVYVGAVGSVHALATADGTKRWEFATGSDTATYVAAVADGTVFVDDFPEAVYALDADDGGLKWRFPYPAKSTWFLQHRRGTVYFGTEAGTVYAVTEPDSTPVYDAYRTATGPLGLSAGGLLGTAALAAAYRRRRRAAAVAAAPIAHDDFERVALVDETPYAEVFEVRTPGGTRAALKRLAEGALSDEVFEDAVEAWAGLDCDGVLSVREWGTDPSPWVATEWATGGSLANRADDLTADDGVRIVAGVAEIVHRAHREGVAHGRLVPGNVLVTDGGVRVADWRLAAALRDPPEGYAPPEDDPDPEVADTYQLGALAFETLVGETPPESGEFSTELGDEIAHARLSDELTDVLSTALAGDPADRYDSPLKFADSLRWAARERSP